MARVKEKYSEQVATAFSSTLALLRVFKSKSGPESLEEWH